jgi:4-hydroxy-4-methyl-2-oxoglutarate aldolase
MPLDRRFRMAGEAFTVKYVPAHEPGATGGDFVDDLGPGRCGAGQAGSARRHRGDGMSIVVRQRGIEGTVIDGICRDVDLALDLEYPLYTRGHWMRTGNHGGQLEAVEVPVTIGGVVVEPGDYLIGDANGVVAVSRARAAEVLEVAGRIRDIEDGIRATVRGGLTLREVSAQGGYHQLQTRAD